MCTSFGGFIVPIWLHSYPFTTVSFIKARISQVFWVLLGDCKNSINILKNTFIKIPSVFQVTLRIHIVMHLRKLDCGTRLPGCVTSCVNTGELLSFSDLRFLICKRGIKKYLPQTVMINTLYLFQNSWSWANTKDDLYLDSFCLKPKDFELLFW